MPSGQRLSRLLEEFFKKENAGIIEISIEKSTLYIEAETDTNTGNNAAAAAVAVFDEFGWPGDIQELTIRLVDGGSEDIYSVHPDEIQFDEWSWNN